MFLLAAACLALSQQGLMISTSRVDITPDTPLPLGGYTERRGKLSIPGGDKLCARTVSFMSGKTKIAVVSVDMLTVPESLCREVKKRIPSDMTLFLAATHTHSAPDSQMLNERMTFAIPGIAKYDPKWLQWYAHQIAKSISSVSATSHLVTELGVAEGHADFNIGRRKFAQPDQMVSRLVSIGERAESKPWAPIFTHYAAHATFYPASNLLLKGDWPGSVAESSQSPVLQGAIGDVLPKNWGPTPAEGIAKMSQGLFDATMRGRTIKAWDSTMPVRALSNPIDLGEVRPHPTMAKSYGVPEAFAESIVKQFAPTSASVTAFRIGKLAVVGIPGEPTSILGRQIRDAGRRMGFKSVLVCSHVNGWMGYILDPEDYDRGGYEATLSFYGRDQGTKVVEAGIEALKMLSKWNAG